MPGNALDRSMRLGVFVDAGQVYGSIRQGGALAVARSVWIQLRWNSPIGR